MRALHCTLVVLLHFKDEARETRFDLYVLLFVLEELLFHLYTHFFFPGQLNKLQSSHQSSCICPLLQHPFHAPDFPSLWPHAADAAAGQFAVRSADQEHPPRRTTEPKCPPNLILRYAIYLGAGSGGFSWGKGWSEHQSPPSLPLKVQVVRLRRVKAH